MKKNYETQIGKKKNIKRDILIKLQMKIKWKNNNFNSNLNNNLITITPLLLRRHENRKFEQSNSGIY